MLLYVLRRKERNPFQPQSFLCFTALRKTICAKSHCVFFILCCLQIKASAGLSYNSIFHAVLNLNSLPILPRQLSGLFFVLMKGHLVK